MFCFVLLSLMQNTAIPEYNDPDMPDLKTMWILQNDDGHTKGPFSTKQILKYIQEGVFSGSEKVAKFPDGKWQPISQEPEFYDMLLDTLQNLANPQTPSPEPTETIIMPPPPPGNPMKKRPEVKALKTPAQVNNEVEIQKTAIQLRPQAEAKKTPDPIDSMILDLEDVGKIKKRQIRKQTRGPVILLIMMSLAGVLLLWPESSRYHDKINLLVPQKGGPQLGEVEVKQKLSLAVRAIENDTFEHILEAQNNLVAIIEGAPSNLEARGLLCYVYKELWPYCKQDTADQRAISGMSQSTRVLNIASPNGMYCEAVKLYAMGRYKEARGTVEGILESNENFSLLPIVYQFKAEIIETDKDLVNSIPYYEKAGQIWPAWIKPKVSAGFALTKTDQGPSAAAAFREALTRNQNHKMAKIGVGLLEYKISKQRDSALATLSAAIELKSRIPRLVEAEALFTIAEILNEKGEHRRALTFAEGAYSLNPSSDVFKSLLLRLGGSESKGSEQLKNESVSLGDQYAQAGDHLAAQAEYKTAFELDPKNGYAALKAAKSLWKLNQGGEAIEWLKKAQKADPKLFSAYVLQADYLSERFDFAAAGQVLAEANRQNPNNYEILRGMALLELRKNNMVNAINFGIRSLKLYDADIETYIVLSRASRSLALSLSGASDAERRDSATRDGIRYATKAVELDATNAEAQIVYSEMLASTSGIDTGVMYLRELIKKYSFSNEYRVALGDLLRSEERFTQAKEAYAQVTMADPKNKRALIGLGLSLKALALNDQALTAFLNAALADPSDAGPLFHAAQVYQETNRYEEATNQFRRVLKVNPNYPRTHYSLGRTAFLMGNLEGALVEIKEEKKKNPNVADSYILAAEIFFAKHQYSDCATEYSMAMKLRPQGAAIYVKAAQCYRKSGSVEIAEDMLGLAEKRESGFAEIYKEQGAIFQTKGDIPGAVRAFQKYLELSPNAPDRNEIEALISKLGG